MPKNNYTKQLEKLNGRVSVKFISDNGQTKWLCLSSECCQAIGKTITDLNNKHQIIIPE